MIDWRRRFTSEQQEELWRASKDWERREFERALDLDRHKPVRSQEQIASDMEMDRQAARDGYNPNR